MGFCPLYGRKRLVCPALTVRQIEQSRSGPLRSQAFDSRSAAASTHRSSRLASAMECEKHLSAACLQSSSFKQLNRREHRPAVGIQLLLEGFVFVVQFSFQTLQVTADRASRVTLGVHERLKAPMAALFCRHLTRSFGAKVLGVGNTSRRSPLSCLHQTIVDWYKSGSNSRQTRRRQQPRERGGGGRPFRAQVDCKCEVV